MIRHFTNMKFRVKPNLDQIKSALAGLLRARFGVGLVTFACSVPLCGLGVSSQVLAEAPLGLGEERVAGNEQAIADEMVLLIKQISQQRQQAAVSSTETNVDGPPTDYYYRFNQVETLGCFEASFEVYDNLPLEMQKGLFAKAKIYPAKLRFANASTFDDAQKDLRGLSIRVNLNDAPVASPVESATVKTQTFLMNSHPVLFADTPETFLKFIRATAKGQRWWFFLNPFDAHLKALWILFNARDYHTSPFDVQYWTTTPSRFGGDNTAAKFSAKPCSDVQSDMPSALADGYLTENMQAHLEKAPVCFELLAQLQRDPYKQPIEDASVHWKPSEALMVPVATIRFSQQAFDNPQNLAACEREVFDPWDTLPEHVPLGGMNRVRKSVYKLISKYRLDSHNLNTGD